MGGGPANTIPSQQQTPVYQSTMSSWHQPQTLTNSSSLMLNSPRVPSSSSSHPFQYTSQSSSSSLPPPLPPIPDAYARKPLAMTKPNEAKHYVRLIYAKSGFHLRTETGISIHGFFALISNHASEIDVYIAWIPEHLIDPKDLEQFIKLDGHLASEEGFPNICLNMGQGETTSIALNKIYSLYICPPSTQCQGSIVITTSDGDVLRPLWYDSYNDTPWPGYDIIDILGAFTAIKTSPNDSHVYLITRTVDRVSDAANLYPSFLPTSSSSSASQSADPLAQTLKDFQWNMLERFARVTRISRDTAAQVLDHPIAKQILPLLPPSLQAMSRNWTVQETMNDYDRATYYLARWGDDSAEAQQSNRWRTDEMDRLLGNQPERGTSPIPQHTRRAPISPEEWIELFDDQGRLSVSEGYIRSLIFRSGLHPDIRIEAWKFLLSIYPWDSTFDEREAIRRSHLDAYYEIKAKWFNDPAVRNTSEFMDQKHRIDKDVHRTDRTIRFFAGDNLPNPDPDMAVGTNANLEIMKDILVTYNFYNTDLGYIQGMSDLLAPLFVAMGTEEMAFWGFVKFMDRVQSNFYKDQSGMHSQLQALDALIRFMDPELSKHFEKTETSNLFFCFRWLLVWFKREFEWEDVIRLWEILWTEHLSSHFLLFIALAILDKRRDTIINTLGQFDEVLKYINDLSGHIDLQETLERAEVLFYIFEQRINAMDRKRTELIDQLRQRAVWNSAERPKIEESIEKLKVDIKLRSLLKSKDSQPASSFT